MTDQSSDKTTRKHHPFSSLVLHIVSGNAVCMVLRMISGILQGRLVLPATLGLFTGIGLVLRYAPFLQLGILDGLYRELPFHIGKDDRDKAEELAAAAQAWALSIGGVVCSILLGVALWQLAQGKLWLASGWFTNAILGLIFYYNTYYLRLTYRTSHDFSKLALVGVVESVFNLLCLALVAWLNFYGLCLRALLVGGLGTILLFHWRPLRVRPKWNIQHLKHLFRIGIPIFSVGQMHNWWTVLNSTLVLKFAGFEGMGLYSMVIMTTTTLGFIPQAVTQVVYPRMAEEYGRSQSVTKLMRIIRIPMILTATGLIPIAFVGWYLMEPTVQFVVPAYAQAVPAMRWALLIPIIGSFYPTASLFQVIRRQDLYAISLGAGMATYLGVQWWLIRDEVTLVAFPQAMLAGRIVFSILCIVFVECLQHKECVKKAC